LLAHRGSPAASAELRPAPGADETRQCLQTDQPGSAALLLKTLRDCCRSRGPVSGGGWCFSVGTDPAADPGPLDASWPGRRLAQGNWSRDEALRKRGSCPFALSGGTAPMRFRPCSGPNTPPGHQTCRWPTAVGNRCAAGDLGGQPIKPGFLGVLMHWSGRQAPPPIALDGRRVVTARLAGWLLMVATPPVTNQQSAGATRGPAGPPPGAGKPSPDRLADVQAACWPPESQGDRCRKCANRVRA